MSGDESSGGRASARAGAEGSGGIFRTVVLTGLAMGSLIGVAEVAWAYQLEAFLEGRTWYLPTDDFWGFVLVAITVDAAVVLLGALLGGLFVAIVRAILPFARRSPWWDFLCRWGIVGGASSFLFLYWFASYLMNTEEPWKVEIRAASVVAIVVLTFGLCWLLERARRRWSHPGLALWATLFAAIVVTAYLGFASYRERHVRAVAPVVAQASGPPVVFITLDTLRYDFLSVYGNEIVRTPQIERFAADAVVFESAIAQAPNTTPSHASMMTSLYPSQHRAMNGIGMRTDVPTLAELLRGEGYKTSAFVAATPLRSTDSGLHRGFDLYVDSLVPWSTFFGRDELQQLAFFQTIDVFIGSDILGQVVTDRVLAWLRDRPEGSFFTWVHYFDAHEQYDPIFYDFDYPNPYQGKFDPSLPLVHLREAYGGRVNYVDGQVGQVLDELREQGIYDESLIILTADHGDAFGERHDDIIEKSHASYLFDTTQHVPLIIKPPHNPQPGRRIRTQVQLVDLAPTILEIVGLPQIPTFEGTSLAGLLRGDSDRNLPEVAYFQRVRHHLSGLSQDWKAQKNLVGLRTPEVKFICNNQGDDAKLYDLVNDPGETTNLASQRPEDVDRYREQAIATLMPDDDYEVPPMDPAVLKKLQALGYLLDEEP